MIEQVLISSQRDTSGHTAASTQRGKHRTRFLHGLSCSSPPPKPQTDGARHVPMLYSSARLSSASCLPPKISRCCRGSIPSFSSTRSLMRAMVSVESMSISVWVPVSSLTLTSMVAGDQEEQGSEEEGGGEKCRRPSREVARGGAGGAVGRANSRWRWRLRWVWVLLAVPTRPGSLNLADSHIKCTLDGW